MSTLHALVAALMTACLAGCGQGASPDPGASSGDKTGGEVQVAAADKPGQPAAGTAVAAGGAGETVILELKSGKVTIKLRPDLAPKHVERVKQLVKEGFYNGLKFHRVIPGFMAQTGDPLGTGAGGSKYPDLPAEFTPTPFERGTIGAARTMDPNSANSQFFICFTHTPHLNGQYTVWGQVVDGMQLVDKIAAGEPPAVPDTIVKMYMQ